MSLEIPRISMDMRTYINVIAKALKGENGRLSTNISKGDMRVYAENTFR
jgi:hypothetical protein